MIARAGSRNFLHPPASEIHGQSIKRAPRFERSGRQLCFQLKVNLHSPSRQRVRRDGSSHGQVLVKQFPRFTNASKIRDRGHWTPSAGRHFRILPALRSTLYRSPKNSGSVSRHRFSDDVKLPYIEMPPLGAAHRKAPLRPSGPPNLACDSTALPPCSTLVPIQAVAKE